MKNEALKQLIESLFRGLRLLLVYMVPSVVLAVILSPELRDMIADNTKLAIYAPVINVALIALADQIKRHLDKDSLIRKAL